VRYTREAHNDAENLKTLGAALTKRAEQLTTSVSRCAVSFVSVL
jgi:hypothetical protein